MLFIIQYDETFKDLDIEMSILKDIISHQKHTHELMMKSISYFNKGVCYPKEIDIKKAVPVGSLDFVGQYLKNIHGIFNMNPIEVPNELRKEKYLCRKYSIVKADKVPRSGFYFIKDVSELKQFSYSGDMELLFSRNAFSINNDSVLNSNHLYQVSELVDILSEYRVVVSDDMIKGIQFYNGDPTIMPTPDEINKIKEMILVYMLNKDRPKSYALDVAIIKSNNTIGRDLMIVELCPFICVGTYGFYSKNIPYMYRDGVSWYIDCNIPIELFSNF